MDVFEILVNLSIALITIDLGIYAIANSMLLGQLRRNSLYAERRLSETREEIRTAAEEDVSQNVLDSIQERINEYQEEKHDLDIKITSLTVKGAVLYPCLGFGSTLFLYSIRDYIISNSNLTLFSIQILMTLSLLVGIYRIFLTLRAIEYASTNIPLPEFDVFLMDHERRYTCYLGESTSMEFMVHNRGYAVGELLEVTMFMPEGSIVNEDDNYSISPQSPDSTYPRSIGVCFDIDIIHVDIMMILSIDFTPPTRTGVYQLPVLINEKNITQKEFMLELEVLQRPTPLMNIP